MGFILLYIGLIAVDIYTFFITNDVVLYIFTQALLFFSVLFYYYSSLNATIKQNIHSIFFLVILIIGLFLNEKYNCEKMMSFYPHFPYHIIIEILGIVVFGTICRTFYAL